MWVLGMITFWTTRATAVFAVWFTLELLLSGRLVPLALMPSWARALAGLATGGTLLAEVAFTAALATSTRWAWKQGLAPLLRRLRLSNAVRTTPSPT
jgi:hypothetical protein